MRFLYRGDEYNGGLYVGTSKRGVDWICRDDEDFDDVCRRFDKMSRGVVSRVWVLSGVGK